MRRGEPKISSGRTGTPSMTTTNSASMPIAAKDDVARVIACPALAVAVRRARRSRFRFSFRTGMTVSARYSGSPSSFGLNGSPGASCGTAMT